MDNYIRKNDHSSQGEEREFHLFLVKIWFSPVYDSSHHGYPPPIENICVIKKGINSFIPYLSRVPFRCFLVNPANLGGFSIFPHFTTGHIFARLRHPPDKYL
jgi:hypothetical protein